MSNLHLGRDRGGQPDRPNPGGVVLRPARREEVHTALRLIIGPSGELASEEQVVDFLRFSVYRKIDLRDIWLAEMQGRMAWAILPVVSPGRTMLMFTPAHVPQPLRDTCIAPLIERVLDHHRAQTVELAQVLLDPDDEAVTELFRSRGFETLAELVYLERDVRRVGDGPLPEGFRWETYSQATHPLFAQTITATYDGSLDCPRLNGRRNIEDVLSGHKAAGEFDPNLWFLLRDTTECLGVVLLSRSTRSESMELVYLGLTLRSRGKHLGDALMTHALTAAASAGSRKLSLAVDSRNSPALNLYHRHGLQPVCTRSALIRDLGAERRGKVSSTAHPHVR